MTLPPPEEEEDPAAVAHRVAEGMNVDIAMARAALGATTSIAAPPTTDGDDGTAPAARRVYDEAAARALIQSELDLIQRTVPADSDAVQLLVAEGYRDVFLVRRALAFAEGDVANARAILQADRMDEEAEARAEAEAEAEAEADWAAQKLETEANYKTVNVAAGFDPTAVGAEAEAPPKDTVIFEATAAQVQELVLESPVPVLLGTSSAPLLLRR